MHRHISPMTSMQSSNDKGLTFTASLFIRQCNFMSAGSHLGNGQWQSADELKRRMAMTSQRMRPQQQQQLLLVFGADVAQSPTIVQRKGDEWK